MGDTKQGNTIMIKVMLMFDNSALKNRPDLDKACGTVVEMNRLPCVGELVEIYANDDFHSEVELFSVTKVIHWVVLKNKHKQDGAEAEIILKPGATR